MRTAYFNGQTVQIKYLFTIHHEKKIDIKLGKRANYAQAQRLKIGYILI